MPLNAAADSGHFEVVKLLLDKGADHNAEYESYDNTLQVVSHKGHVRLDEPQHINPNRGVCAISGNTPAWLFGSVAQCYGGQVPRIALTGHVMIAEMLLNKVADISYRDHQGRRALHLACAGGNLATIEFLSDDSLGLTITDKQGRNFLHHGASSGSASTTAWLINKGLDPNFMDRDGWTPLHWAAKSGSIETLENLRDTGAIPSSEYINRWTPQDVASFHHHGRLPVLTSNTQVGTASGYSARE